MTDPHKATPPDPAHPEGVPGANIADGVLLHVDSEGRVAYVDEFAERLYGRTGAQLTGRLFEELVPPEWRAWSTALLSRFRSESSPSAEVGVHWDAAGSRFAIVAHVVPEPTSEPGLLAFRVRDARLLTSVDERCRRAVRLTEKVEDEDRQTLSRDLHDSVGQLLALSRMKLAELRESGDSTLRERVTGIESVVEEADRRIRTLSFRLSPASLHELGLGAAAHELAEDMQARFGLAVLVDAEDFDEPLVAEQRSALFRGMRELLINVARHSGTANAELHLRREGEATVVDVVDHGDGFDPRAPRAGFGLFSLRQRLTDLGGELKIRSIPGDGTRARMRLPVGKD